MLTKEELKVIRESLPYNSTKLIKAKIKRISDAQISRTLNKPECYRKDIIDAAIEVIKDHKASLENQKSFISDLSA